jgi:hypothetical protein
MSVIIDHVKSTPQAPSERTDREIPGDLESVILDCLKKDSGDRPSSALELKQLLSACSDAGGWDRDQAAEWWTEHLGEREEAPTDS